MQEPTERQRPAWLRGMAFSFGGCIFLVGAFVALMIFIGVLAIACSILTGGGGS